MENYNECATPMEVNCNLVPEEGEPSVDCILYKQLVESLIYLTTTRLDISHSGFQIHARGKAKSLEGCKKNTQTLERNNRSKTGIQQRGVNTIDWVLQF